MKAKQHSVWTIAAIACIAFVICDLTHEVIGHGVTAYFLGAQHLLLSSTYLSSDINSKLVDADGTIANLVEAALAWLLLRKGWSNIYWRYFLWLLIAFNLLGGTGYFLFSAVFNSGDWAEIVKGLPHPAAVRLAMGLTGATAYVLSAYVCASPHPFLRKVGGSNLDSVLDSPRCQLRCCRPEPTWHQVSFDFCPSRYGRSKCSSDRHPQVDEATQRVK